MIVEIRNSFQKDAKKLPASVQRDLFIIVDNLHSVSTLNEIHNCKKLSGFKNAYRIRSGNYRIGLFLVNKKIELTRVLSRKDIYRYFP
jgi:mRNA interferase RelE/StbE